MITVIVAGVLLAVGGVAALVAVWAAGRAAEQEWVRVDRAWRLTGGDVVDAVAAEVRSEVRRRSDRLRIRPAQRPFGPVRP
jgi:hypothetical protein